MNSEEIKRAIISSVEVDKMYFVDDLSRLIRYDQSQGLIAKVIRRDIPERFYIESVERVGSSRRLAFTFTKALADYRKFNDKPAQPLTSRFVLANMRAAG